MTSLAAINLDRVAKLLASRFLLRAKGLPQRVKVIPALEVTQAKLTLGILFGTGTLAGIFVFDSQRRRAHKSAPEPDSVTGRGVGTSFQ
jgi:hypothetical protein